MKACLSVVRADLLGDPGAAGDPADDAGGAVPVQPQKVLHTAEYLLPTLSRSC
jgi:hypothetical protein